MLGRSAEDGWTPTHYFAHDDEFAYDSAGRHSLPYHGLDGSHDVCELDQTAEDWGIPDEEAGPDGPAAAIVSARAHALRHGVLAGAERGRTDAKLLGAAALTHRPGGQMTVQTFDLFFDAEESNEEVMRREAGPPDSTEYAATFDPEDHRHVPASMLGTALDSWRRAPNEVRAERADGADRDLFEAGLQALVERHGADAPLENLRAIAVARAEAGPPASGCGVRRS